MQCNDETRDFSMIILGKAYDESRDFLMLKNIKSPGRIASSCAYRIRAVRGIPETWRYASRIRCPMIMCGVSITMLKPIGLRSAI